MPVTQPLSRVAASNCRSKVLSTTTEGLPPYFPGRRLLPICALIPASLVKRATRFRQTRFQELDVGSVIHLSFEGLQAVDLSLRLAVGPRLCQGCDHGRLIRGETAGE